jgi:hypothetical protein
VLVSAREQKDEGGSVGEESKQETKGGGGVWWSNLQIFLGSLQDYLGQDGAFARRGLF